MAAAGQPPPRCPMCGDVVGAYEPAIALTADGARVRGSTAALGPDAEVVELYHRDCLEPPAGG